MRNGSHRLWLCIAAVAAASLIAVPAASGGGFPGVVGGGADVVEHDTEVTIFRDRGRFFHGDVKSEVKGCEGGRWVGLFKQRPGADRKLGTVGSTVPDWGPHHHNWGIVVPRESINRGDRTYAKTTRKVGDRFVCRAGRSETLTWPWEISPGNFIRGPFPRAS